MQNQQPIAKHQKEQILRIEAKKKLDSFQRYIGSALIASSAFGAYLLATDKSLWLLAVSHAVGLAIICVMDVALGVLNLLLLTRRTILPSYACAFLTMLLQLGDIATAPQYKMTVQYFASYLFGLWAYDAILLVQLVVIVIGLSTRKYQKLLVRKKQLTYFDLGPNRGRRDFLQIAGAIGGMLAMATALGIWGNQTSSASSAPKNSGSTASSTTPTSSLPSASVANTKNLQVGVPVYFDYPSAGYTNMLMKKSDGSVSALSILCTHVCCQCQYDSSNSMLLCPCHGSVFDQNGNVLRGPASTKLPSIQLSIDGEGNVFPVKIVGSGPCVSG